MTVTDISPPAEPEASSYRCPQCSYVPPAEAKNPELSLRGHVLRKHSPGAPQRGAKGEARTINPRTASVTDIITTAAREGRDAIEDRSERPPNVDELNRALGRFVGTLSVSAAAVAAETDPTVSSVADRDAIVDYLSFSPSAARDVAYPFARALGHSKLNNRFGRAVVDNVDVASALGELTQLGIRWRRYLGERDRRTGALPGAPASPLVGMTPAVPTAPPQAAAGGAVNGTGAGEVAGKVLTFEDVQRIRAAGGQS